MIKLRLFYLFGVLICTFLFSLQTPIVYAQNNDVQLPQPEVIIPGKKSKAPSDAIVLFDNGSLDKFESVKTGGPAGWKVGGRKFTVTPKTGNIQTRERFGDCQLHIEWKTPKKDVREGKEGQQNGNSGVYLMGKYEVQVLNSYINKTYPDGQAGAIYKQHPPLVNASKKPGKWQAYDIIFTAPRYNPDGSEKTSGYFTVFHNGVLIQNHAAIGNPTTSYNKNNDGAINELPLMLQDHSNLVSYRNIWIRKL